MLPLSGTLVNWKGEGETPDPTKLIVVYYSSVSGNMTMKGHQNYIFDSLNSLKITYLPLDISMSENTAYKDRLRITSPRGVTLPQVYYGSEYRADYDAFEFAVEDGTVDELLFSSLNNPTSIQANNSTTTTIESTPSEHPIN